MNERDKGNEARRAAVFCCARSVLENKNGYPADSRENVCKSPVGGAERYAMQSGRNRTAGYTQAMLPLSK
jgi:hypothetical protein